MHHYNNRDNRYHGDRGYHYHNHGHTTNIYVGRRGPPYRRPMIMPMMMMDMMMMQTMMMTMMMMSMMSRQR